MQPSQTPSSLFLAQSDDQSQQIDYLSTTNADYRRNYLTQQQ